MDELEQALREIPQFAAVHAHLCSSGQPSAADLAQIKAYGFSTVMNVALSNAEPHLALEDQICLELDLNYIHLPLAWETPNAEQALLILDLLHCLVQEQMVWLHCAKNYRVSCLMALYKQYYLQQPIEQIHDDLHAIWQPNETWTGLMHSVGLLLQGRQSTLEMNQLCAEAGFASLEDADGKIGAGPNQS